jgi:hypothetical protein
MTTVLLVPIVRQRFLIACRKSEQSRRKETEARAINAPAS